MANTIMTAKNSFAEGLIMDFAPDNTQATCMTSALNATLLTFNGNEMSLQNDMGNGRVETAFLPEGYIPVGTCEFGDIIYIVSYNPITDKSQIGCFPSPERNISSEELYDGGQTGYLNLSYEDFLEKELTGKLKNTSVKKVLIDNKKLNPGDKYIIYTDTNSIKNNVDKLSDCFNKIEVPEHDKKPLNVKLHVVSIEDSGKITYLDTTTKWYDTGDLKYYISSQKIGSTDTDLDSYRNLVSSNWSIFSSKVSGKLAILAELEMIDTFSCSYDLEFVEDDKDYTDKLIKYKKYDLYLCPEAFSAKGIELSYICLTKAFFNNSLEGLEGNKGLSYTKPLEDYLVYYYGTSEKQDEGREIHDAAFRIENGEVLEKHLIANDLYGWQYSDRDDKKKILIGRISIPYQQRDATDKDWTNILSNSFIYTLEVTPAMDYGRLEHLAVQIVIDFNKIGTGEVSLTTWKYHNVGTTSILTYGIEAYPKPNWEVTGIIILFYDNLGLVGEYLLNDKKYYSGVFTEYFGLDGELINSRFNRYNSIKKETILHLGEEVFNIKNVEGDNNYIEDDGKIYINDAATLYSGFLYAAKITVKQKHKDTGLEVYSDPSQYRWFWTNPMFNEYYYSVKDFKELKFELILNGEAIFETTPYYQWKLKELNNLSAAYESGKEWKTYSANAQYIGYGRENNINMYVYAGLLNDYGCFNLHGFNDKGDLGDIQNIRLDIYLDRSEIKYSLSDNRYEFSNNEAHVGESEYLLLNPQTNTKGCTEIADTFSYYLENASNLSKNKIINLENNIKDLFNIYFSNSYKECNNYDDTYIPHYLTSLDKCCYISENNNNNKSIPLSMLALLFNKAYVQGELGGTIQVPVYTPIIDGSDDLASLGIVSICDTNNIIKMGFESAVALCHRDNKFSATRLLSDGELLFYKAVIDDSDYKYDGTGNLVNITNDEAFLNKVWANINPNILTFFPLYLGGHGGDNSTEYYSAVDGTINKYASTAGWKYKGLIGEDNSENNSKLTKKSFDVTEDADLADMSNANSISFLGVKYKDGFTVLNSAFLDTVSKTEGDINVFTQKDLKYTESGYDNFAYLLYLLLSNTYHKNKKIENLQIKIKNYVRNGNYGIELIKHVIIELKSANDEPRNIIMRGFDFKNYVNEVLIDGCPEGFKTEPNVTLKFLGYAKDHELKVLVNSLPMSFFDTEVEAYIRRNGLLQPVIDLAPNSWYIYLNGELGIYANNTLTFSKDDITNNLKYVFANDINEYSSPKLQGVHFKKNYVLENEDIAYNTYLDYLNEYIRSEVLTERYYSTLEEARLALEQYINNMFNTFPESVSGYSKHHIMRIFMEDTEFISLFTVYFSGNLYIFRIHPNLLYNFNYRQGKPVEESHCELTTNKFLNIFDYLDYFMTSSTKQLGNIFGVKESDKNSAYTGFAKNIMLNTYHKVV